MTDPFMRVDISQTSRDFQAIALEPGLPVLDRSNSNGQTLRAWLGELVAEPERTGESIGFYVRDAEGRRLDSAFCVPASDKELAGELARDFVELRKRMAAVRPKTSNEQLIHRVVNEQVQQLTDESKVRDRRCCLFRYRDGKNKLHLVWAPGYRRRDNEPAAPLVCTNGKCSHLFLQRRDTGAKCPVCQAVGTQSQPGAKSKGGLGRTLGRLAAVLFFVALGVVGAYVWQKYRPDNIAENGNNRASPNSPLKVEPANWTGPIGSQVQFVITRSDDGDKSDVVTTSAAATVANPKILSVKPYENLGKALSIGKTDVTFYVGTHTIQASITVVPRGQPKRLTLEPASLIVGVGTTARMKLLGEMDDGKSVDLTDDALWDTQHKSVFFVHKGRIEGEEPGTGTVRVRYHVDESSKPMEATAEITVKGDIRYKSLKLTTNPPQPVVGQPAHVQVAAISEDGKEFSLDESKGLTIDVTPAEFALKGGAEIATQTEGKVKLKAHFQELTAELEVNIAKSPDDAAGPPDVSPKKLELKVGELAKLSVRSGRPQSLQIKSAQPSIAEVTDDGQIVGRSLGTTEIQVTDGDQPVTVPVTVSGGEWTAIALEPARLSLRSDETVTLRIYGVLDAENRVELAPDQVTWASLPRPDYVNFEPEKLEATGLKLTGDRPERLTARHKSHEASAEIEVVSWPVTLTLSPAGKVDIPFGQKQTLTIQSKSGGSAAIAVPADRVEWILNPENAPFEIKDGVIYPPSEPAQMRLAARYQGATSNEIQISSVEQPPLTLKATATPSTVAKGGTGAITVSATGLAGAVELNDRELQFSSISPEHVTVDESTGAFRAGQPGTGSIRVAHARAMPVAVTIHITEPQPVDEDLPKPVSLRLVSKDGGPVSLPVGAECAEWRVEAVDNKGQATDVSHRATLVVDGDSTSPAVAIRQGKIVGVNPGEALIHAEFGGVRTAEGLQVAVTSELKIDEIRIVPESVNLLTGESAPLRALGFQNKTSVGDLTNRTDLIWRSADPNLVTVAGPQVTANPKETGKTTVVVSYGPVISQPATIQVLAADEGQQAGQLVVVPARLRLRVGETAALGQEIKVLRQQADFSDVCDVAPPSGRVTEYNEDRRTFQALSPGNAQILFIHNDQTAMLDIEVVPDQGVVKGSKLVIEPATGRLSVGEELPVRVYVVDENGRRTPVTPVWNVRGDEVAEFRGDMLVGLAPGEVNLEMSYPGIDQPATAQFVVTEATIEQLEFHPGALVLEVGQRKSFDVFGVTPQGRIRLGDTADLELKTSDANQTKIELSAADRDILGLEPGAVEIIATWKSGLERKLPVTVKPAEPISEIVLQPNPASVEVGNLVDFQVLARRGERLEPLQPLDGVTLQTSDPVIAAPLEDEFRIQGLKAGTTQVTATFGRHRVQGYLTVMPRTQPAAPPARPERLRFLDNFRQMDLGYPGAPVRVVRVLSDGREEDVDHLVELTVLQPDDIVTIEKTDSGPIIRPAKVGQTHIEAVLPKTDLQPIDLKTQQPLLIEVSPRIPRQPELRPRPPTLRLLVRETGRFTGAEIRPPDGSTPIPVPFTVTATENRIFEVLPDQSIRAKAVGTAAATLTANDPNGKFPGIASPAIVEVSDPEPERSSDTSTGSQLPPELTLSGPSETSVGAEIQLRVERAANGRTTDETNRAELVLIDGEEELADVRTGGRILAKSPGRIHVQAKLGDLTSAVKEIVIRPIGSFERLELEVTRGRMGERESRPYKLWGHPVGGGTRQDLTNLVANDGSDAKRPYMLLKMIEPSEGTEVAVHRPGVLKAQQPGTFSAQARLGEELKTEEIQFQVVGDLPPPDRMKVQPTQLVLRTGEETPPIEILVASRGDRMFRNLDPTAADITSNNDLILKASQPGRFIAGEPGAAKINVAYQGLEQVISVQVKSNPFVEITVGRDPKFMNSTLTVNLTVNTDSTDPNLEYRVTLPDGSLPTKWVEASKDGKPRSTMLTSPQIPMIKDKNHYSVIIEAKSGKSKEVERHPFSFRLITGGSNASEANEKKVPIKSPDGERPEN